MLLKNAQIAAGTTVQVNKSSATLDGLTLAGTLNLSVAAGQFNNSLVTVLDGLTLAGGQVNLSTAQQVVFNGSQTLGGNGTVASNPSVPSSGLSRPWSRSITARAAPPNAPTKNSGWRRTSDSHASSTTPG